MKKMTGNDFDHLVRFFDGMAQTSWLGSVHNQLKEVTGLWNNKTVLDVGCGTGRMLIRGANEASSLTGIDLSEGMVEAAKELFKEKGYSSKSNFIVGDACALPFSDDEFDLAISTCVLFLLPEPESGMREILRVVREGGMIVMLNPSSKMNQNEAAKYCKKYNLADFEEKTIMQWSNISTLRHRYDKEQLKNYFKENGAKRVRHEEVLDGLALITLAEL
ncbi:class I SAM-dependent methyltransferase [Bacillus sp. FJAT-45350]|uniref:class I SAM-dependent methyltransferase n=1 Tax=Bacillus sp. FJAT-45350 TaxID=2011014 RepID=UPI000BB7A9CD|nr:class I SAM-dependent methyltransferase [Bacillus sp. FJAT-45350]